MALANCPKVLVLTAFLAAFNLGCDRGTGKALGIAGTTEDLSIGRMRVAIWPEYDDPSLLVIYDGRFEDVDNYPIKTSFFVPKGSVISDACSLSHEGQHFCQLYKTINRGEYDEVSLLLPFPNFYLSFHTPRFDVAAVTREFNYWIKANHSVKTMEVDIQQPLRSSDFSITSAKGSAVSREEGIMTLVKGFNHFAYSLDNINPAQEHLFVIKYTKNDPKPSVDIKYASMTGPKNWNSPYETQKSIKGYVYLLFGTSLATILAVVGWHLRTRRKKGKSGDLG